MHNTDGPPATDCRMTGTAKPRNRRNLAIAKISLISALGFLLAACAGGDLSTDRQQAQDRVNAYLAANPETHGAIAATMRRFTVQKGMTPRQVQAVLGKPKKVKKWSGGAKEQWYFGCDWPNHCRSMGNTRRGRSADDVYPQALFENGLLYEWKNN